MRILRYSTRSRPGNCHDFGGLPSAPRAAHPRRELLERHLPPDQTRERLRLNLATGAALACDAHQEVAELVIETPDMREHLHGRMVPSVWQSRPCSAGAGVVLDAVDAAQSMLSARLNSYRW
jgi:hypothetical protein